MLNVKGIFLRLRIAIKVIFIAQLFVFQNAYADSTTKAIQLEMPNASWWNKTANSQTPFDTRVIADESLSGLKTLAQVQEHMLKTTAQPIHIAIQKTDTVNAFARYVSGYKLIIFTTGFIRQFGNDPNVLANTLGHEMAHHALGHIDSKAEMVSLASSEPISKSTNKVTQVNELAADNAGIEYAIKAGYSACGAYRLFAYLKNNTSHVHEVSQSSHPMASERLDLANKLNLKTQKAFCS